MNTSTKTTLHDTTDHEAPTDIIFIGIALTIGSLLIVLANVMVIYVYKRNKSLRKPKYYYIIWLLLTYWLV